MLCQRDRVCLVCCYRPQRTPNSSALPSSHESHRGPFRVLPGNAWTASPPTVPNPPPSSELQLILQNPNEMSLSQQSGSDSPPPPIVLISEIKPSCLAVTCFMLLLHWMWAPHSSRDFTPLSVSVPSTKPAARQCSQPSF